MNKFTSFASTKLKFKWNCSLLRQKLFNESNYAINHRHYSSSKTSIDCHLTDIQNNHLISDEMLTSKATKMINIPRTVMKNSEQHSSEPTGIKEISPKSLDVAALFNELSTSMKKSDGSLTSFDRIKSRGLKLFIYYYFETAGIPLPSSLSHSVLSSIKKKHTTHVHHITLPEHVIDGMTVQKRTLKISTAKKLANSSSIVLSFLCKELLKNVRDCDAFVDTFMAVSRGKNSVLSDQLNEPLSINIDKNDLILIQNTSFLIDALPVIARNEYPTTAYENSQRFKEIPKLSLRDFKIPSSLGEHVLPIHSQYANILHNINKSQVTIISAETGAGKTTQIPQFILSCHELNFAHLGVSAPNIIVTQPRKIAATSVAERVASERGEKLGKNSVIGYSVRFKEIKPTQTHNGTAIFCTTGVFLRKLQSDPLLSKVTHILLDEVHERDLNTDLLLSILSSVLKKRPDLRVILMSATADTNLFQKYFDGFGPNNGLPPVVQVKGKCFPVVENYLEDISRQLHRHSLVSKSIQPFFHPSFSPRSFEEQSMYLKVINSTIDYICMHRPPGAILVFLSGWNEISVVKNELMKDAFRVGYRDQSRFKIFALHSSVPMNDQKDAFTVYDKNIRKIILATNIAETSITIKDIVYVVDSGIMKLMRYDSAKELSTIKDELVSQSNTRQRIGRAGRVQSGEYYSILPKHVKLSLPLSITTEMQRSDLQTTVLQLKSMKLDAKEILKSTPEPPHHSKVIDSIKRLESLGAIDAAGNLTAKGVLMSKLPLNPWISNLILQGIIYKCLDPLLTIASIISSDRSPFSFHPTNVIEARQFIRKNYAKGSNSDQITSLNAIQHVFSSTESPEHLHAQEFEKMYLKKSAVVNIAKAKSQFMTILEQCGIVDPKSAYPYNKYSENIDYVKAIFGKSLYPNIATIVAKNMYKGRQYRSMRLTGSSVNCFSAQGQSEQNESFKRKLEQEAQFSKELEMWDFSGLSSSFVTSDSVSFPKLLAYQELHQVESNLFLRNTSEVCPLTLALLTPCKINFPHGKTAVKLAEKNILIDEWLNVSISNVKVVGVLKKFKEELKKCEDYVLARLESGDFEAAQNGSELHEVLFKLINKKKD